MTPELKELEIAISSAQSTAAAARRGALREPRRVARGARRGVARNRRRDRRTRRLLRARASRRRARLRAARRSSTRAASTSSTGGIRSWRRSRASHSFRTTCTRRRQRGALHPADRAEHGREVDVPAASGAARDPRADRLVRPGALDVARASIDRIFTRIGAGDDLASGQSTFYVEMSEASNILRRCTPRSLLLIDEVGRGTGTIDGLAIAQAICEYLLGLDGQAPMVLFATHFHELVALGRALAARRELPCYRRREHGAQSALRCFHTACCPAAPRARSGSRSRGWPACRRASSSARARSPRALEERPTLEAQVPLRESLGRPGREEVQLTLGL